MIVPPECPWFKFLRSGGSADMNVDGSVTPVKFQAVPTVPVSLERLCVQIVDGGISPTKFAGLTALTNGIEVLIVTAAGATVIDFLDGETIKKNADWTFLAGTDNPIDAAAGDDQLQVRWTVSKGLGAPLELNSDRIIQMTVQDNLTEITEFRILAQGRI